MLTAIRELRIVLSVLSLRSRSMLSRRITVLSLLCAAGSQATQAQTGGDAFLMVKPGDPAATESRAKDFLARFASYLGARVRQFEGLEVGGHIANREEDALRILDEVRPELAFVPVGFYLKHLRDPKRNAHVVAEVPRLGMSVEQYYIAVRDKGGPESLAGLRGKRVSTVDAIDWPYLTRVVFPDSTRPGEFFSLTPSVNLSDDVFAMTQGGDEEDSPDGLLLDEELRQFFASDDLVWPQLKIVWKSEPLPRDLVVALGTGWNDVGRRQLLEALAAMKEDENGGELLGLMRSDGFTAPNRDLLRRTTEAYDRPPKDR